MKLGFIGTGAITTAMVESLCSTENPPSDIVVSPRNKNKAEKLATQFDNVRIAEDNQMVVDECEGNSKARWIGCIHEGFGSRPCQIKGFIGRQLIRYADRLRTNSRGVLKHSPQNGCPARSS